MTKKNIDNFELLLFTLLAIKLNNKVYSTSQVKNTFSLNYKDNKLLFYQFGLTNMKIFLKK
jgi:hypothetical protein